MRPICLLRQLLSARFVASKNSRRTIHRQRFGARAGGPSLQWIGQESRHAAFRESATSAIRISGEWAVGVAETPQLIGRTGILRASLGSARDPQFLDLVGE